MFLDGDDVNHLEATVASVTHDYPVLRHARDNHRNLAAVAEVTGLAEVAERLHVDPALFEKPKKPDSLDEHRWMPFAYRTAILEGGRGDDKPCRAPGGHRLSRLMFSSDATSSRV